MGPLQSSVYHRPLPYVHRTPPHLLTGTHGPLPVSNSQAGSQTDQCVYRGGQSCRMSTHLPTHSFEILGYTTADVPRSHPHDCLQSRETQDCRHSPACSQVATRPHLTAYGLGGRSHRFIGKHLGAFAESSHQFTCCQGKPALACWHICSGDQPMSSQTHSGRLEPISTHRLSFSPFRISGQKLGAFWSAQGWHGCSTEADSAGCWAGVGEDGLLTPQKP